MTVSDLTRRASRAGALLLCMVMPALPAIADEAGGADEASLAMQLSNPVAALISVPLQLNYDQDIGPADDGDRWLLNIQPVIPFDVTKDWNVITRTILPLVWQPGYVEGQGTTYGLGDLQLSAFLSPAAPGPGGLIWGAGDCHHGPIICAYPRGLIMGPFTS